MKANSTKRKIFDAVDLLTEDTSSQMPVKTMKGGVTMLDIDSIKPFHNHPFHLYEGDRLDDMVESIRDHGILNPVIVREIDDGYEMLSGHNRQKAAKIAGLKKIGSLKDRLKEQLTGSVTSLRRIIKSDRDQKKAEENQSKSAFENAEQLMSDLNNRQHVCRFRGHQEAL